MADINTWPGWECVRELGTGSFGKVYEIQREERGKIYKAALKVITIPFSQSDVRDAFSEGMTVQNVTEYFQGFVETITEEFALMSKFKGQSNIVSYEDHMILRHENDIGWDILIRMELLTSLREWSMQYRLTESDVIALGCDICHALELCGQKHIIHRDIKPENIFISEYGDYKLGDFGIARTVEKTMATLSQKGTYTYIAPEVYKGQEYGQTADIYSLGLVLYRYLNENKMPFLPMDATFRYSDRDEAFKRRICGEQIPPPVNGSPVLKEVILKSVAYLPQGRYRSAHEFGEALKRCISQGGGLRTPPGAAPRNKKKWMLTAGVSGVIGLILAFCVMAVVNKGSDVPKPSNPPVESSTVQTTESSENDSEDQESSTVFHESEYVSENYRIKILETSDNAQIYKDAFTDSVYLGRSDENDIVLDEEYISRRHCRIINRNGRFFIEDLKSTNGTFVNGDKISGEAEIFSNTKICLGDKELIVVFEAVDTDIEPESTEEDAENSGTAATTDLKLYSLDDIGLSVKVPSEFNVLTREMDTQTKWMIMNGITLEDVSATLDEGGLYLLALDDKDSFEINIGCVFDGSYIDIRNMSVSDLETQISLLEQQYRALGSTVFECSIYQSEWTRFTKIYFTMQVNGNTVYALQYGTCGSDRAFNITLTSESDELTSYEKDVLQLVVDSIRFTDTFSADDNVFRYESQETGISFMIPDNWEQQDKDNGVRLFTDADNSYNSIAYQYADMWEGQESLRKYVDNSYVSQDELAEMMGVSAGNVSEARYGDETYYDISIADFGTDQTVVLLAKFYNGYCHVFRFVGDKDSIYYRDFERLMSSIKYPDLDAPE